MAYATIAGDVIVGAAYSHELPGYGLNTGLSNYAAGYCTGLLLARRLLTKYGLAETYAGVEEIDGESYKVEEEEDAPRPFCCVLDTGLKRTSTGSKVFSVLKVRSGFAATAKRHRRQGHTWTAASFSSQQQQQAAQLNRSTLSEALCFRVTRLRLHSATLAAMPCWG